MSGAASGACIRIGAAGSSFPRRGADSATVAFYALGCRLNQSEAASLEGGFAAEGFRIVHPETAADIAVINTCSVTHQAEAKCRALIRRILRKKPETFIAVTGCYAQAGVAALKQMEGVDLIAGTDRKTALPQLTRKVLEAGSGKRSAPMVFHSPRIARDDFTVPSMAVFDHVTRPNVKIQDGCDFFCSFCIIPYTRGRSRSRRFDDILLEAEIWAARGHREIVLTGVNLGAYASEGKDLTDLVDALSALDGLIRIRISSIEPTTVPLRLLDRMASPASKLCPYLHLPLQSGSDRILTAMGRRYTRREYSDFVREAVRHIPRLGLGTDVMVGFPGEDDAAFQETLSLLAGLPFSYLHVFPYSRRKGTRVTRTRLPAVPPAVIKARSRRLRALSDKKADAFREAAVGTTVPVLFERRSESGLFRGLTDHYLRVGVETDQPLEGRLRPVRIETVRDGIAIGRLAG